MTAVWADTGEPIKAVVVGSGFAGAVTACRLAQAGVEVHLLERGRRYGSGDFPALPQTRRRARQTKNEYEPPGDFARWLWAIDRGLWDVRDLDQITSIQAAGYGGGSLVYANVHLRAPPEVFTATHPNNRKKYWWPAPYRSNGGLDEYYDLAAYMLGVQVFPHDDATYRLAKTSRLQDAGRGHWFLPPLAVNFDPDGPNRWGKLQGKCDLRGFCCLGCNIRAKNTLDLNYLAIAEAPADGTPITVTTLAEVEAIKKTDRGDKPSFAIEFRDHLLGETTTIDANVVFLCAGAINTTELLCASGASLLYQTDGVRARLGLGYFPNGDSIGIVFDAEHPHEVDRGPTITSSLAYEIDGNWFLVQDGGVPEDLDAVLGVFRSPLWLRRNRFREHSVAPDDQAPPPPGPDSSPLRRTPRSPEPPLAATPARVRTYRRQRPSGAREMFAMLPPKSAESVQTMAGPKFPRWLTKALEDDREEVIARITQMAEPVANEVLEHLATLLERRLIDLGDIVPGGADLLKNAKNLGLARGLLRLGAQLLWGSESDAIRHALHLMDRRVPRNLDDTIRQLMLLMRWSAAYVPGDGRTSVLLTMGRDPHPGRLIYEHGADRALTADLADLEKGSLRVFQERALRDIAVAWKGELRTDPAWTFARRRVTVHSQGGCRMSDSEKDGVTDPYGQIHGCENVYVMDAAAFPTAVGVNPSATIAAVAEYKVEHFIRTRVRGRQSWRAPELAEAIEWATPRRAVLDPLNPAHGTVKPLDKVDAELIGITFRESMEGYFSEVAPLETSSLSMTAVAEFHQVIEESVKRRRGRDKIREWVRAREDLELAGIRQTRAEPSERDGSLPSGGQIGLIANASIEDLTRFLEQQSELKRAELTLDAWLCFENDRCVKADGTLSLVRLVSKADSLRPQTRMKLLEYQLKFEYNEKPYQFFGVKVIEDDPRLDVWADMATLYFGIAADGIAADGNAADGNADDGNADERGQEVRGGVLRLPAQTFLEKQIKSIAVTGTTDPARQVWALTAFLALFSTELLDTYLPELKGLPEVLKNMLTKTHG